MIRNALEGAVLHLERNGAGVLADFRSGARADFHTQASIGVDRDPFVLEGEDTVFRCDGSHADQTARGGSLGGGDGRGEEDTKSNGELLQLLFRSIEKLSHTILAVLPIRNAVGPRAPGKSAGAHSGSRLARATQKLWLHLQLITKLGRELRLSRLQDRVPSKSSEQALVNPPICARAFFLARKGRRRLAPPQILCCASSIFARGRLDFQGMGVYPSDDFGTGSLFRRPPRRFIVRMSPPGYPSAWLLPSRACFRFTRRLILPRSGVAQTAVGRRMGRQS